MYFLFILIFNLHSTPLSTLKLHFHAWLICPSICLHLFRLVLLLLKQKLSLATRIIYIYILLIIKFIIISPSAIFILTVPKTTGENNFFGGAVKKIHPPREKIIMWKIADQYRFNNLIIWLLFHEMLINKCMLHQMIYYTRTHISLSLSQHGFILDYSWNV